MADPISSVFWSAVMSTLIACHRWCSSPGWRGPPWSACWCWRVSGGSGLCVPDGGLEDHPSITASLVTGIEPVLNPVLVAVFYHEYMGVFSVIGACIVIVGVVGYNVLKEKQQARIG